MQTARSGDVLATVDELRELMLNRRLLEESAAVSSPEDASFVLVRRSALRAAESRLRERLATLVVGVDERLDVNQPPS